MLGFIPDDWLHGLDYSTLEKVPASYVADDLRKRSDDVVWRVRTGEDWLYLYILIEEPGEELRDKVQQAADMCPTAAITIEG